MDTHQDRTPNTGFSCSQDGKQADRRATSSAPPNEPAEADLFQNALEILRSDSPAPTPPSGIAENPASSPAKSSDLILPARMMNEFVYCPRLFYYEFVEGIFVENADTLKGSAIHARVDSGNGSLPPAAPPASSEERTETATDPEEKEIHSRSVTLGSDRLGVVAKMDLVEVRRENGELFALEVCPVDYKAGAPKRDEDGADIWDTDKMQLGLQALLLRENGYNCHEGVIYYRATKQRVRLPITAELETWVLEQLRAARSAIKGPMPPPLVHSPKCPRCSLVTICLPDETRLLQEAPPAPGTEAEKDGGAGERNPAVRRLIAPRDDVRSLYLNTPGLRVGRKGEVLQVKEKDKVVNEARIRDVGHLALFGNIQLSTQALQTLCEREVPITYFSMGGWFYGITRGHDLKNVFLRIEQFKSARDPAVCLELAKRFVRGKIRNHRTLLMRNHLEPPKPALARLKRLGEDVLDASRLEELLGMEGTAARIYFQEFQGMLKTVPDAADPVSSPEQDGARQPAFNFNFNGRNRRPPTDPVNALLSLAYSLLSKDCTLAALATGFDPYVGFYHQPRFGRPALALDLMEEFRPLIAESAVLSCINNRVVSEKDFVRAGLAVNLTSAGRTAFFQMYEQRMNALIIHPVFDYKVSYRRALELQARLLAKTLTGEIHSYLPFTTR